MRATTAFMVGLAATLAGLANAQEQGLRVALIHGSFGDFRHRDDYDGVMKSLGWTLDKYENKDFGKLAERLGDYDLILGTALFNYHENVQDFSPHKDALLGFMDRGGAIVLTDANYGTHVDWLAKWGEDWGVELASCKREGTPMNWLDATHPVFSALTPIRQLNGTWMHMLPGEGWQVISRCEDGEATGLFRTQGRGFMLLTNYWAYGEAMLRNIRATQELCRAGVLPRIPDLTGLTLGENALTTQLRNLTEAEADATVALTLKGPGVDMSRDATTRLAAGATGEVGHGLTLPVRGAYDVAMRFVANGQELSVKPHTHVTIPDLLEVAVTEPKYRGDVMLAGPGNHAVTAHYTLHPFGENLEGARVSAVLSLGGETTTAAPAPVVGLQGDIRLALPKREAGTATLEVVLHRGAGGFTAVRKEVRVVATREPQVFIDEDLNTRVNGELFFPIAVYHPNVAEMQQLADLGFNSLQAWGTNPEMAKQSLDAAQAAGLKVILEGVTLVAADDPAVLAPMIEAFESHPALLSWYLTDEPSGEERLAWCRRVYEYLVAKDPHHPVFLTSCSPGEFGRYWDVTDIFAVDPYPIPGAVTMVSDWMIRAQEAVKGRKPVWLIPQLHNWSAYGGHPEQGRGPTAEEERNMVYQGLVWGAKAIFYYPWDDGVTGLKYDAPLAEAVKAINAELAVIGPELLKRKCETVARNDDQHPGLYAAIYRGEGATYVIAVSVLAEPKTLDVPAPGLPDAELEVLFEGREATAADGVIRDEFAPLAVHVYRTQ